MGPLLGACAPTSPDLGAPFGLAGAGVVGVVRPASAGCGGGGLEVGLWGPGWGTDGVVPAEVRLEDGDPWLYFSLETGLGEGSAALRLRGETATLPLGARPGEFDVALGRGAVPKEAALARAEAEGAAAVATERQVWADGHFRLMDGGIVVGDLRFEGERAQISVYDATWITPIPADVPVTPDGADLVLAFPVEPALEGETAQVRVNAPTRAVVVPASAEPTELDRHLVLAPGEVPDAERAASMAAATAAADALERRRVVPLAVELAAAARTADGRCKRFAELGPDWELLLPGYEVHTGASAGGDCEVEIAPIVPQHGRRFRGRVNRSGLVASSGDEGR